MKKRLSTGYIVASLITLATFAAITHAASLSVTEVIVTPRATLSGVPIGAILPDTTIEITVEGDEVSVYQYKIGNQAWSPEYLVTDKIYLDFSSSGTYTLAVIGGTGTPLNIYQDQNDPTIATIQIASTGGGGFIPVTTTYTPYCGNGIVDTGEQCDDGNTLSTDYCVSGCALATCSDGLQNQNETGVDCGGSCNACGMLTRFFIKAEPERRYLVAGTYLAANGLTELYDASDKSKKAESPFETGADGTGEIQMENLVPGTYDARLKAAGYLARILRNVSWQANTPQPINLDFTLNGTQTLLAGDLKDDNQVNALDLSYLLNDYGKDATSTLADFNKDGSVNASDIALLILNYLKNGETL